MRTQCRSQFTTIPTAHNEIGVIAPYHAQCVKIRKMLSGVADEVKVGSVEEFQGQVSKVQSFRRSVTNSSY